MNIRKLDSIVIGLSLFTTLIYTFLITYGEWNFSIYKDGRSFYHSILASQILTGNFNVPLEALSAANFDSQPGECFIYEDKCFGYFGMTPTLLRILNPVTYLVQSPINSALYMSVEIFLVIFFSMLIFINLSRLLKVSHIQIKQLIIIWLLCTFSPLIFLFTRGYVYEESILVSILFFLIGCLYLIKFQLTGNHIFLIISILSIPLTINARINEGIGLAVCLYLFIIVRYRNNYKKVFSYFWMVSLGVSSYFVINYLKFGAIMPNFEKNYGAFLVDKSRLEFYIQNHGFDLMRMFKNFSLWTTPNLANWPFGLNYRPGQYNLNLVFFEISNTSAEQTEGFTSLPLVITLTTMFIIFGIIYIVKNRFLESTPFIIGSLIVALLMNGQIGQTLRYGADFYPLILFLSSIGVAKYSITPRFKSLTYMLITLLGTYQAVLVLGISINFWNDIGSGDLPIQINNLKNYLKIVIN